MGYYHYRVRVLDLKKSCFTTSPPVKDCEACIFRNIQIASSNLKELQKELDNFLHLKEERGFTRCELFVYGRRSLIGGLGRDRDASIVNEYFPNPFLLYGTRDIYENYADEMG
jgi:hypothetical protein